MSARSIAALLAASIALAGASCKKQDPIEIQQMEPATGELKEIKQLPDFQLIDSNGKTVTLRRLHQQLKDDNRVLVSKSLAVAKHRITLGTLITALFYDLSSEKPIRIPTQSEKRERE